MSRRKGWEYRIVRMPNAKTGVIELGLHEVGRGKDGKIKYLTKRPVRICERSWKDLAISMEKMAEAMKMRVIDGETREEILGPLGD